MKIRKLRTPLPEGEAYRRLKSIERLARAAIEEQGYYQTIQTTSTGPDIIGHRLGKQYRFEVKLACWNGSQWITNAVTPLRKSDHFVAIVLPNKQVYLQPMPHHLQACEASGARVVTHLVRRFCPEFLKTTPSHKERPPKPSASLEYIELRKKRWERPWADEPASSPLEVEPDRMEAARTLLGELMSRLNLNRSD